MTRTRRRDSTDDESRVEEAGEVAGGRQGSQGRERQTRQTTGPQNLGRGSDLASWFPSPRNCTLWEGWISKDGIALGCLRGEPSQPGQWLKPLRQVAQESGSGYEHTVQLRPGCRDR